MATKTRKAQKAKDDLYHSSLTTIAILYFDGPVYTEDGMLLIETNGEIVVMVDPVDLIDYVEQQAQDDPNYGDVTEHLALRLDGSLPGWKQQKQMMRISAVVCQLLRGKDAWGGFEDYEELINAIADGYGTASEKFAAIRRARSYWKPDFPVDAQDWDAIDKAARARIRKDAAKQRKASKRKS